MAAGQKRLYASLPAPPISVPKDVRPIPGFPGYVISRRGEVYSYWQSVRHGSDTRELSDVPHLLKTRSPRGGKRYVDMRVGDKRVTRGLSGLLDLVFHESSR